MGTGTVSFEMYGAGQGARNVEVAVTHYYCRAGDGGDCRIGSLLVEGCVGEEEATVRLRHTVAQ